MPLDPDYRAFVESQLDECDAALVDKPNLASIFHPAWRADHRAKMLNVDSPIDVSYPSAYAKPHQELFYPTDYQQRLEDGAAVLMPKLDDGERNHLIRRMRGVGCLSADEELLLARGFAHVFTDNAISFPSVPRGQDIPEFHVSVGGHIVEVEAKGLTDEQEVRELNEYMLRSGQHSWSSFNPRIGNLSRLRAAIAKKLLTNATGDARILVLTQYTAWITPTEGIPLIRALATNPAQFDIPAEKHALAITYATDRWIAGVWFNSAVVDRLCLTPVDQELIRRALRVSLYDRASGVFFSEQQSDDEQTAMIAKMVRIAHGASE